MTSNKKTESDKSTESNSSGGLLAMSRQSKENLIFLSTQIGKNFFLKNN